MFYFCHSENPSIYMKILSNSNPMYSWKKNSVIGKCEKHICYKENKSPFFWCHEKWPKFSFYLFGDDRRFLFSRKMENIRTCKKVRLKKLVKFRLPGKYQFWYLSSCLKTKSWEEFGRGFSFSFSAKCSDRKFKYYFANF